MKRLNFVTAILIMNILLSVMFAIIIVTRYPQLAAKAGRANATHSLAAYQLTIFGTAFWIACTGIFAGIGLSQKGWATILSAIMTIIFFGGFFILSLLFIEIKPSIPKSRYMFFLVISGYALVSNILAIFYYFKHRKRSGEQTA